MRIAIIEDNESIAKGIAYRLGDRGHATDIVSDGLAADEFLRGDRNDLVILDVNLPGLDGFSILRGMRARNDNRPVLLLTARSDTEDRVSGLDAGADDYLVKPFEMDELEARIRALSRRAAQAIQKTMTMGRLRFDVEALQATANGRPMDLPRREAALLEALMRANGRAVPKSALLEHLYGTGADVEESAIEVHVSRLRKKLRPLGLELRAQRGIGYVLQKGAAAE